MSGFEVVGVTLAILPLLVSAAEHFDDCIRPILRYRKLVSDVQTFNRKLDVQKAIFINQSRIILEGVVEHDDAVRMLAARSGDPSWQDQSLDHELLVWLGDSREACKTSIELITEKLQTIQEESQDLRNAVDHERVVKHRLTKKVRACLGKSPLEGYINTLRNINDDFLRLSNQIRLTENIITKSYYIGPTKLHNNITSKYKIVREDFYSTTANQLLARTRKRELGDATIQQTKKKNVRFHIQDAVNSSQITPILSKDLIAIPRLRTDFCDVLRKTMKTVCNSPTCLGLLESDGSTKHRIYTPPLNLCHRVRQKSALSDLIDPKINPRNKLSHYEKLHLAKVLSIALLQYCSTPWLAFAWRSQEIFFFNTHTSGQEKAIDVSAPHINVRIRDFQQPRRQLSFPALDLAPNAMLFSLGIILLELAFSSSLHNLQQRCDLENGRPSRYLDFFIAKRLSDTVVREMGITYAKIVRKLLQCSFDHGNDLNDARLQGKFHRDVVCELERLEQDFADMTIT